MEPRIKSAKLTKIKRTVGEVSWYEHLLEVEGTIDFDLWFSDCESWIMPEGEYEFVDDSNDMHLWMDDFMNIHWLVKVGGHIQCKAVNISRKLQELAEEKYLEHLYDQELDNS